MDMANKFWISADPISYVHLVQPLSGKAWFHLSLYSVLSTDILRKKVTILAYHNGWQKSEWVDDFMKKPITCS